MNIKTGRDKWTYKIWNMSILLSHLIHAFICHYALFFRIPLPQILNQVSRSYCFESNYFSAVISLLLTHIYIYSVPQSSPSARRRLLERSRASCHLSAPDVTRTETMWLSSAGTSLTFVGVWTRTALRCLIPWPMALLSVRASIPVWTEYLSHKRPWKLNYSVKHMTNSESFY